MSESLCLDPLVRPSTASQSGFGVIDSMVGRSVERSEACLVPKSSQSPHFALFSVCSMVRFHGGKTCDHDSAHVRIVVLALAVLAGIGCSQARADLALWYNGDFNGSDAFNNLVSTGGVTTSAGQALVYDDFVVPAGQTWTIDKVYSNDALGSNNSTTAYWEIRSGVSAGSGGSLLSREPIPRPKSRRDGHLAPIR